MNSDQERWDRRSKPMPLTRVELPFSRCFSADEIRRLSHGLIPLRMEDKWFGILRSDSLDFYRSWTGYLIYRLAVHESGDGIDAGPLVINNDPKQYIRRGDHFDLEMVERLIDRMLSAKANK